ncbi:MAG: c-type cytochrome [Nitrospiria bacterium]
MRRRNRPKIFSVFFLTVLFLNITSLFDLARSEDAIERGKMLIEKIGCLNCHAIDGKGGVVAPDLSHVHERLHEAWLYEFLKDPYEIRPLGYIPYSGIRMPNLRLSDDEAQTIAHYLSTLKKIEIDRRTKLIARLNNPEGLEEDIALGKRLLRKFPCLNCHTVPGGANRLFGPNLSEVGSRLQPAFIYLWIENPQAFDAKSMMPNYGLKDRHLFPITRYLMSLRKNLPTVPDETPSGMPSLDLSRAAKAEKLFRELCIRCHSLDGQGGTTGPDLTYEGDKVNPRWTYQFLKQPFQIRPLGFAQNSLARMPNLNMNNDELVMMTEFISTLRKGRNLNISITYRVKKGMPIIPALDRKNLIHMGKMVINMKGCTGCHRIGKLSLQRVTIGPDLTYVGDRLKEAWIYSWIKNPQKYRADTLMPNLGLTDMQAQAVAAYLSERKSADGEKGGEIHAP